jgi:hypothetical protein
MPIANKWQCEMGNAIHDMIAKMLGELMPVRSEKSFKFQHPRLKRVISGRWDNDAVYENKSFGIEIKTTYGRSVVDIQKTGKPKHDALVQAAVYLFTGDIKTWYLLYIGRDTGYRTQFKVTESNGKIYLEGKETGITFDKIVDKFVALESYLEQHQLPDREYQIAIKQGELKIQGFQKKYKDFKRIAKNIKEIGSVIGVIIESIVGERKKKSIKMVITVRSLNNV